MPEHIFQNFHVSGAHPAGPPPAGRIQPEAVHTQLKLNSAKHTWELDIVDISRLTSHDISCTETDGAFTDTFIIIGHIKLRCLSILENREENYKLAVCKST